MLSFVLFAVPDNKVMSGKWDLYYMLCIAWVVKDELKIPSFKNIFEDSVRHICTVLKIEDPQLSLSLSLFFFSR